MIVLGWSGGSYLAEDVWNLIRQFVPAEVRKKTAKKIYDLFVDQDADDWDDDMRIIIDKNRRIRKNKISTHKEE